MFTEMVKIFRLLMKARLSLGLLHCDIHTHIQKDVCIVSVYIGMYVYIRIYLFIYAFICFKV